MGKADFWKIVTAITVGVICGIIFCTLIILLSAWLFVRTGKLPLNSAYIIMQIIGALSSFAGSYVSVRIYKSNGLVIGLITAFILFVIIFLTGLVVCVDNISMSTVTKMTAMLCAGALGGILSVNKKKRFSKYR